MQTQRVHVRKSTRNPLLGALTGLIISVIGLLLVAQAVNAVAVGYESSDDGLSIGMVASLSEDPNNQSVVRATRSTASKIVGVVVEPDEALVTVSSGHDKVLVESEGVVKVYVTDLGGEIKQGDSLVMSPIKGVLMKGNSSSSHSPVLGISSQVPNFSDDNKYTLAGKSDQKIGITQVKITFNKSPSQNESSSASALSDLGQSVTGREISSLRILFGVVVFMSILAVEGAILYGAVSSSITAVGRNPLSKRAVRWELLKTALVALLVFAVGLTAIYLIVWL